MSVVRIKDFVTEQEARELTSWVLKNHKQPYFLSANMGGARKTTRYSINSDFEYPAAAHEVRKRIVDLLGVHEHEKYGFRPPFKDGIVASYAPPGDICYEHIDPIWHEGFHTLHCNVITQAPEAGGVVIVEGMPFEMQERELFCYLVSRDQHEITEVVGNKVRCMWVFGFCILDIEWKEFYEKR